MTASPTALPAAFLGHGSPMNAVEHNRYTEAWQTFGTSMERPRAILSISAHWYVGVTAVTAMATPPTIHDFAGFPPELFAVQYPAPGSPDLAAEVRDLLAPTPVVLDEESWGLDHGTWSVLVHAFPEADVPVVQLSIDANLTFDEHLALGAALSPLRERGVAIIGSGNVVHNLRRIDWGNPDAAFDWTIRFDEAVRDIMRDEPGALPRAKEHPDFALAAPTPDHFIPLLYLAGLATATDTGVSVLVDGYDMGSISMTAYALS